MYDRFFTATVQTTLNGKFLLTEGGSIVSYDTFDELVEGLRWRCFELQREPEAKSETHAS